MLPPSRSCVSAIAPRPSGRPPPRLASAIVRASGPRFSVTTGDLAVHLSVEPHRRRPSQNHANRGRPTPTSASAVRIARSAMWHKQTQGLPSHTTRHKQWLADGLDGLYRLLSPT